MTFLLIIPRVYILVNNKIVLGHFSSKKGHFALDLIAALRYNYYRYGGARREIREKVPTSGTLTRTEQASNSYCTTKIN